MHPGPPHTGIILSIEDKGAKDGYQRLILRTPRGHIETRLYEPLGARVGVIAVGGAGGGFDSPAKDLYGELGDELPAAFISLLRVKFRDSTDLDGAIYDVRAGLELLTSRGVQRVGLIGHSFGGAVVIAAGAQSPAVATVVTLATQSYGADDVEKLAPRSLLMIHGTADEVLPPGCSGMVFRRAQKPKELRLVEGAGHVLDEAADEIRQTVSEWIKEWLRERPGAPAPT